MRKGILFLALFAFKADANISLCSHSTVTSHVPHTSMEAGTSFFGIRFMGECEQSEMFASALKKRGGVCDLLKYEYYDHNVSSKTSDKMEEIFFKSVDFLTNHIK